MPRSVKSTTKAYPAWKILFERSAREWLDETDGLVVHGLRVQAADGSTLKTEDTPKNSRRFGRPGSSRGRAAFPQLKVVALADVGTRIVRAARWARYRKAEVDLVRDIVSEIAPGTLTLLDSGLFAYDLLWSIHARGGNFLARLGAQAKPKVLRELGPGDAIVEVTARSYHRKRQPDMPRRWTLRMITYRPGRSEVRAAVRTFRPEGADEDIRLITDLMPGALAPDVGPREAGRCAAAQCAGPESGFTHDELANLYHDRWESETVFDEIKTHLCECPEGRVLRRSGRRGATVNRPAVFRSKTPDRVVQELLGMLTAYNAIRKTIHEAARRKDLYPQRVSFTSATERVREATYEMMRLPTARLPGRYKEMLAAIARRLVPKRPGRSFPREVKIKMSCYPLKRRRRAG